MGNHDLRDDATIIRPSSLVSWGDCARRAAADLFRREVEDAGFKLNRRSSGIGAVVGTAVHAGAAHMLEEKLAGGAGTGAVSAATDVGIQSLRSAMEEPVSFDATSPNVNASERQISRMVRAYASYCVPIIQPVAVEERLQADCGDGFVLSGQSDVVAVEESKVVDTKTGAVSRTHAPQLGAYAALQHSHGRPVKTAAVDFIQRVKADKDQPPPKRTEYGLDDCIQIALHRIDRVKREVLEFRRRVSTGDSAAEFAFDVNPSSMLCHRNWCSAFGTRFCAEWRHKGGE